MSNLYHYLVSNQCSWAKLSRGVGVGLELLPFILFIFLVICMLQELVEMSKTLSDVPRMASRLDPKRSLSFGLLTLLLELEQGRVKYPEACICYYNKAKNEWKRKTTCSLILT